MSSRPVDIVMHPEALWDLEAIMIWGRYEETQARKLTCDPDFPRPARLTGPGGHPRWWAGEIWEWARSKRPAS